MPACFFSWWSYPPPLHPRLVRLLSHHFGSMLSDYSLFGRFPRAYLARASSIRPFSKYHVEMHRHRMGPHICPSPSTAYHRLSTCLQYCVIHVYSICLWQFMSMLGKVSSRPFVWIYLRTLIYWALRLHVMTVWNHVRTVLFVRRHEASIGIT
jgi:hypothetical protein